MYESSNSSCLIFCCCCWFCWLRKFNHEKIFWVSLFTFAKEAAKMRFIWESLLSVSDCFLIQNIIIKISQFLFKYFVFLGISWDYIGTIVGFYWELLKTINLNIPG